MHTIDLGGHRMEMLGHRALWWPSRRALICADLHLGKDAAFRALGVAIPPGSDNTTLTRLSAILGDLAADELIVLGDLFHARHGQAELRASPVGRFFQGLGQRRTLVLGNHDTTATALATEWGFDVVPGGALRDGIQLCHEPPFDHNFPTLAGHWHPSVRLPTGAKSSLRLPAFLWKSNLLVLPAFGEFTGTADFPAKSSSRIFVCLPGEPLPSVREVEPRSLNRDKTGRPSRLRAQSPRPSARGK
ncbi:MAG: ligase-associated DNA damage response endonuclease PdeM [Terrimicrobiaceae bacterium]